MGKFSNLDKKSKYRFIDLKLLIMGEEKDMTINMDDLHIILSLNSILRLYQFGMYYFGIYSDTMFKVETEDYAFQQDLKKKILELGTKEEIKVRSEEYNQNEINKEYMARLKKYVQNIYTVEQAKDHIKKTHKKKNIR